MTTEQIRAKYAGALLGTFAGDVLGAPVEGAMCEALNDMLSRLRALPDDAPHKATSQAVFGLLADGVVEPGKGYYTDDTQMTIGVAEALADATDFLNEDALGAAFAARFVANFDAQRGYGAGAFGVIIALQDGAPWDEPGSQLFDGEGSFGNGAAMRIAPVGVAFRNHSTLRRRIAELSAHPTHTHRLGKEGAVFQAAAVAAAARRDPADPLDTTTFLVEVGAALRDDADEYLDMLEQIRLLLRLRPEPCEVAETLGSSIEAAYSVPAALYSFLSHPTSFPEAVKYAVCLGDDTDTVGAMCGAIAGAYHGDSGIPEAWLAVFENGPQGRDYVRDLAERLYRRIEE